MERIVEETIYAKPHGGLEPYAALSDSRARKHRVALLRRVAGFLAQEGPRQILSGAAGPHNETTAQIAKQHADLQKSGDRAHQWQVESLSPCAAAGLSRREAAGLGINVGASLWSTAASREGGPYQRDARAGRKRFRDVPDIERDWTAASHVTARAGPDGRPVRVVYGPKRQICEHIAARRECSISTAYKYSSRVSSHPRKEDMCDYCDLLRRLRIRVLREAGAEADELEGRSVVRERFAALLPAVVAAFDLADIYDLAAREALAGIRQAAFKADWAAAKSPKATTLVARFDLSGALKVTDEVGTKAQYYHAASCSCLGVVCANPGAGSVVLLDPENRPRTARIAAWQVAEAAGILRERVKRPMKRLSLWRDTGKRFRALEFLRELLEGATTGQSAAWAYYRVAFEEIECNFFAEGHGKGERDAMFSKVKHAFAKYIATTDSRAAWKKKIERVARGATARFYAGEAPAGPRWRYCIPAISHAYRVGVKLEGGREVLLVEGKEAPAKVARIADGPEVAPKEPKVGRRDNAIAAAMRTKNAHRRRQGWARATAPEEAPRRRHDW